MCTILTVDTIKYFENPNAIENRILEDWKYNSDGASLVFLDPYCPDNNTIVRCMSYANLIMQLQALMTASTSFGRVFIHLRSATTFSVGVGYTHAFDNGQGVVYMHNGVISNPKELSVDSFDLVNMGQHPDDVFAQLIRQRETFANVFMIDTEWYEYSVMRMKTGKLHTDGKGNYSTSPVGEISMEVARRSMEHYVMEAPPVVASPEVNDPPETGGIVVVSDPLGECADLNTDTPDELDFEREFRREFQTAWRAHEMSDRFLDDDYEFREDDYGQLHRYKKASAW